MNNNDKIQRIQKILLAKRTSPPRSAIKPIATKKLVQHIVSGRSKKTINQSQRIQQQARDDRPAFVGRSTPLNDKVIFLSGGIGDIFSIESFIPDSKKQSLETILYGTRKSQPIQTLFEALPNYPHLKNHQIIWHDFNNFWCFLHKTECENRFTRQGQNPPPILKSAEDYGIAIKFPVIRNGGWTYIGSSFIKHKVAEIDKFSLPEKYVVIAPYSSDKANANRDFTTMDWEATIALLAKRGQKGVVLNNGDDKVPKTEHIIDLSNQTTILESIEVLKRASAYVGIDTCFSVLAAQLFNSRNLLIKCVNNHGLNNKAIYFAPHTTFEFITDKVSGRTLDG